MATSDTTSSSLYSSLIIGFIILCIGSVMNPTQSGIIFVGGGGVWLSVYLGVEFGIRDYRGVPSKLVFRIIRCVVATLLLAALIFIIYEFFIYNSLNYLGERVFGWFADFSLILYLFSYKPSSCSIGKKILKSVGLLLIYISIFMLGQVRQVYETYSYFGSHSFVEERINFVAIIGAIIVFSIGLSCRYYSYKGRKVENAEQPRLQVE